MNTTSNNPSVDFLHNLFIKSGNTVYCTVTRTKTARRVRVFVADGGRISEITHLVAKVCDRSINDNGLLVRGSGFCAVQQVVEQLSRNLYGGDTQIHGASLGGAL